MPKLNLEEIAAWEPDYFDFRDGDILMTHENHNPRSLPLPYSALLYSILSMKEKFAQHKKVYEDFLCAGLYEPETILTQKEHVEDLLKRYGANNMKTKAVLSSAQVWASRTEKGEDIREFILADAERKQGKSLRKELVNEMYGVGFKLTSLALRMLGYEYLVPVDTTARAFVESKGFLFQKPLPSGKLQGLKEKEYLQYEEKITEFAEQYGVTPAHFQATVYAKFSSWKDQEGVKRFFNPGLQFKSA